MTTKLKTHSGAGKRFRVTRTGKVLCKKSCNNHLLTNKGKNNKKFAYGKELTPKVAKTVKGLLH